MGKTALTGDSPTTPGKSAEEVDVDATPTLRVQRDCANVFAPHFNPDALIDKGAYPCPFSDAFWFSILSVWLTHTHTALAFAEGLEHIMEFTRPRVLGTLFSMLNRCVRLVLEYNDQHSDFPMTADHLEKFLIKRLLYALVWSFAGDARLPLRAELGRFLLSLMKFVVDRCLCLCADRILTRCCSSITTTAATTTAWTCRKTAAASAR